MSGSFEYLFPAIRGVQARREYYVSMCPLRLIPKIFLFDENELSPEQRAQRILNRARVPVMARYVLDNPDLYIFSALTASVDGDVTFEPFAGAIDRKDMGVLHVPMTARFIINDGQHRRAAIEMALRERPELADETIAVVFFQDAGLERCQQMFADLNRHAIRPSRSLGLLYENRDKRAQLAKLVVLRSPVFRDVVELEKTTLSLRSRKLFTLSAIYTATGALLAGQTNGSVDEDAAFAADFWECVAAQMPEWELVRSGKMKAAEMRNQFLHSHGIVLHALGRAGNSLLKNPKTNWKKKLTSLRNIDWKRTNEKQWEGRATIGGRVTKSEQNVILTTNLLKEKLGLPLNPEEQRLEDAFRRGHHGASD